MKYHFKVLVTSNENSRAELEKMLSIGYHIMQATPVVKTSENEEMVSGVEYVLYIEEDKLKHE